MVHRGGLPLVLLALLGGCSSRSDGFDAPSASGTCGDGVVGLGEECDEGDANDVLGTCDPMCRVTFCGDGVMNRLEGCDDGNDADGDSCPADCAVCGDGMVTPGSSEECDDGNLADGDGCGFDCRAPGQQRAGRIMVEGASIGDIGDMAFDGEGNLWALLPGDIPMQALSPVGEPLRFVASVLFGRGTVDLSDLASMPDGNVAVVGSHTEAGGTAQPMLWVVDTGATIIQEQPLVLEGAEPRAGRLRVAVDPIGRFIIGGSARRLDGTRPGAFVLVLERDGAPAWQDILYMDAATLALAASGEYVAAGGITGMTDSTPGDMWLQVYDGSGGPTWDRLASPRAARVADLVIGDGDLWVAGSWSEEGAWIANLSLDSGATIRERTGASGTATSVSAGPMAYHHGAVFFCGRGFEERIGFDDLVATAARFDGWSRSFSPGTCSAIAVHDDVGVAVAFNEVDHRNVQYRSYLEVIVP